MNPLPPTTAASDDWLDAALRAEGREHRDGYLSDDGFTARVMAGLPAPAALPAWRKPALAALWGCAGVGLALALPGAIGDATREILRALGALGSQPVSLTGIAIGVVALAAASWTAAAVALARE